MMYVALALSPKAEADLEEAAERYVGISQALGERFGRAASQALEEVSQDSRRFGVDTPDVRRHKLKGFPYCIYYLVEGPSVIVLSAFHMKQQHDRNEEPLREPS